MKKIKGAENASIYLYLNKYRKIRKQYDKKDGDFNL